MSIRIVHAHVIFMMVVYYVKFNADLVLGRFAVQSLREQDYWAYFVSASLLLFSVDWGHAGLTCCCLHKHEAVSLENMYPHTPPTGVFNNCRPVFQIQWNSRAKNGSMESVGFDLSQQLLLKRRHWELSWNIFFLLSSLHLHFLLAMTCKTELSVPIRIFYSLLENNSTMFFFICYG